MTQDLGEEILSTASLGATRTRQKGWPPWPRREKATKPVHEDQGESALAFSFSWIEMG